MQSPVLDALPGFLRRESRAVEQEQEADGDLGGPVQNALRGNPIPGTHFRVTPAMMMPRMNPSM